MAERELIRDFIIQCRMWPDVQPTLTPELIKAVANIIEFVLPGEREEYNG